MDREKQDKFLSKWYVEANRYMDNAKDALNKADREDYAYYKDSKYVRTACGIAYIGVLVALDAWLKLKDVPEPNKKSHKTINYYLSHISDLDNKMVSRLNTAYNILHLEGYYRGEMSVSAIDAGLKAAYDIIEKIKPEHFEPVKEAKGQKVKRLLNNLLVFFAVRK